MQSFDIIDDYVLPHTPPPTPVCVDNDTPPDDFSDISFLFERLEMIDITKPEPEISDTVTDFKPTLIINQQQVQTVPIFPVPTQQPVVTIKQQTCYCIFCNSND